MLPVANPKVLYKALSDGAVLFLTEEEVYFGLNAVGARVWELLPPVLCTMDELVAALAADYPEVDAETIRTDVRELLGDLTAHGLVRAPGSANGGQGDTASAAGQAGTTEPARVV